MDLIIFLIVLSLKIILISAQGRIIRGRDAMPGQFPYQAWMTTAVAGCGGSIIGDRWIMTAAHCHKGGNASDVTVYLGSIYTTGYGGISYKADWFIKHENYTSGDQNGIQNDIALVRLKDKIRFNRRMRPIALPQRDVDNYHNKYAIISGFGRRTSPRSSGIRLQYILVKVLDPNDCYWNTTNSKHICTSVIDRSSTCMGDSGGPVVIRGEQVGIVSYVDINCNVRPNVHARVYSYRDWIKNKMKSN